MKTRRNYSESRVFAIITNKHSSFYRGTFRVLSLEESGVWVTNPEYPEPSFFKYEEVELGTEYYILSLIKPK